MDSFCLERGTLLDPFGIVTLKEPEKHTVHCLIDVDQCVNSPFHVLEDPPYRGVDYGRGWQVTSNDQLIALAKSVGSCTQCTGEGNLRAGFRAAVRGTVDSAGDRTINVPRCYSPLKI